MRRTIFALLLLSVLLPACKPSLNVTSAYVNKEITPKATYEMIFVMALTPNKNAKINAENRMEKLLKQRGRKVVKSHLLFPQTDADIARLSVEQNVGAIKAAGCDAILTMAVVDVAANESYNPGTAYVPTGGGYGVYGSYWGYYNYRSPLVSTPGFYSADKTYYMETNFYDLSADKLLWAIKSTTYNPGSFEIWFQDYSGTILSQLKKDGLIKK